MQPDGIPDITEEKVSFAKKILGSCLAQEHLGFLSLDHHQAHPGRDIGVQNSFDNFTARLLSSQDEVNASCSCLCAEKADLRFDLLPLL